VTDKLYGRAPTASEAATEIGNLVTRILALAPVAGLYIGIEIKPAKEVETDPPHPERETE